MTRLPGTILLLFTILTMLSLPAWAQAPRPPGTPSASELQTSELGQTNPYIVAVVVIVLLAIALAYLLRRKPANLGY